MAFKTAFSVTISAAMIHVAHSVDNCSALFSESKILIPNLKPYVARGYEAGTTFSTADASPAYNTPVPDLIEFCRFGAEYNTSTTSKFRFEIWMPSAEKWNGGFNTTKPSFYINNEQICPSLGRFAFVGNGGDAGGVNYPDMGIPLSKYGFAVASTDGGHNGTTADGTFAMGNPESQIDFGYRAVHMSTEFSKMILEQYYGKAASYNYWIGCSSGGKQGWLTRIGAWTSLAANLILFLLQGMKSIQKYPQDFDGAITGAPAQWWPHLNGFTVHVNLLNANATTPGAVIPTSFYPLLFKEVTLQCDALDGVEDGVITNPGACKPDLGNMACGANKLSSFVDSSTCLSEPQMVTLAAVQSNWTSIEGELLFPTFEPGSQWGWNSTITGEPYGPAPSESVSTRLMYSHSTLSTNETQLQAMLKVADSTNPGDIEAMNPNLKPFFERGGKLMQFHGWADQLIASRSSLVYYEKVRSFFNYTDLSDKYNLFMVPGMGHCSGGPGANAFGGPSQRTLSLGGSGQSLKFDAAHDMILATMDWVENGRTPKSIITTRWKNSNVTDGPEFSRLLCPYPQVR
ncbi:hypothetical protein RSOLAG1IB_08919 [Rhizoctonia solani AG-1 IB]|uniref:Carboxylic ester hydrolase n=1 Tax=Thanatephorus cucumeris (strain AG1-IB / isolate 7/3/14) TaxID=1108050 RepID=A0A0B7FPN9_THACB|nr:hypothetical protein RSOLAG1IB_08919 [Rhizoctonia solani AG-1 IB]